MPNPRQPEQPEIKAFNALLSLAKTADEKWAAQILLQPISKTRKRYATIKKKDYDLLASKIGKSFLSKIIFIDYNRSTGDDYFYNANKTTLRNAGLPEPFVMSLTPQYEKDNQDLIRQQNVGKKGDYTIVGDLGSPKALAANFRAGTQQINDGKTFNSQRQVPAKYRKQQGN